MSEEMDEMTSQVTKQLYRLNLVSIVLCFLMWISSLWYAITMGLKHGLIFQVKTIIEGVERVSTSNTIFNLAMSGMFIGMMITAGLSAIYLYGMYKVPEGVEEV